MMSEPMTDERWKEHVRRHTGGACPTAGRVYKKATCLTDRECELFDECERLRDVNERLTTTIREAAGKFETAVELDRNGFNTECPYICAGMARITQAAKEMQKVDTKVVEQDELANTLGFDNLPWDCQNCGAPSNFGDKCIRCGREK